MGDWRDEILDNGWTAVTRDRSLAAHFEHTVAVTSRGVEILSLKAGERRAARAAGGEQHA